MTQRWIAASRLPIAALAICGAFAFADAASAVTLYNPGAGTTPSDQGWTSSSLGSFTQSVASGVYALDTTAAITTSAGSALLAPSLLDTAAGFTLDFGLRIVSEAHAADNQRAGFSLLFTGANLAQSLELGFRQNEVFAYTSVFAPGAAANFDTTATTHYSLAVANGRYALTGNGQSLLTGALVDYSSRGIPPYTTAGVLFFGDDTTRAQSSSQVGTITLTPALVAAVPEPASIALWGVGLGALIWRVRRRRGSGR